MSGIPKYSIIIPVYNAEKTLHRCLDSILDQNYRDMEIILVNDGSADGSGKICRDYADRHDFIIYIEKANGGVSTARNKGLDRACGTYVLFVDSDDYMAEHYFAALDAMCAARDYDFVMFSHCLTDGKTVTARILEPFASSDAEAVVSKFCETLYKKTLNHPPTKRFVRQIIEDHHIRFPENLYIGEDKVFNLNYVMHCKNCLLSSDPLYIVCTENQSSLSRKIRPDLYEQFEIMDDLTQKIIRDADLSEEYRNQYLAAENMIRLKGIYSEAKRMHLLGRDVKFRREVLRQKCRKNNSQHAPLPSGIFSRLLQIPVRLSLLSVIDLVGWYLAR